VNDLTMTALQVSLRGLAARQRAIADNVANVETPGFIAKRVDFESSLRSAIAEHVPQSTAISESTSKDSVNANGNNVSLESETLDLTDTNLRYQVSIEALNAKFRLLRSSIRGDG
jgi:flagellar basal-body rod protein FlgB